MIQSDRGDRSVSEMVGYILVISIILSSISIAYFNGVPALQNAKESEKVKSAETSFQNLQFNINEIAAGRATGRTTEMSLSGDSLSIPQRRIWVNVSIRNDTGVEQCPDRRCHTSMNGVVFETNENLVRYENGGVLSIAGLNRSGMVSGPEFIRRDDSFVVPVVALRGSGAVTGNGVYSIQTSRAAATNIVKLNESGYNVSVEINTRWVTAWRQHLSDYGETEIHYGDRRVFLNVTDVERVIFDKTVVEVSIV